MILDIIVDSIRYVFSNPKNIIKIGILYCFSFLIFPLFFIGGYNYRIIEESLDDTIYGDSKCLN